MIVFLPLYYGTIESTNDEAKRLVASGNGEGTVIVAEQQTKGRGRLQRRWISPAGNFYATLILKPKKELSDLASLSLVVGLALAQTLKEYTSPAQRVSLKWPNDVMMDSQKIAGILIETEVNKQGEPICYVGVGVNLVSSPEMVAYPTTSLKEVTGIEVEPKHFLNYFLSKFNPCYQRWLNQGFSALREDWLWLAHKLGSRIAVTVQPGLEIFGHFLGVSQTGALLIRDDAGQEHHLLSTEVRFT